MFKLCGQRWCVQRGVISFFGFGLRNVSYGLQKGVVIERADPFQRREFYGVEASPRSPPMDGLGLAETVYRGGESIVV